MEYLYNSLVEWLLSLLTGEGYTFSNGLVFGILFTILYIIVYKFVAIFIINSKTIKGFTLKNSTGNFYVSQDAVKDLIIQNIAPLEAVTIVNVRLRRQKWRNKFYLDLIINLQIFSNVDSLRYHLEQQILKILADNFSMRHGVEVNISIKKFLVDSSKKLMPSQEPNNDTVSIVEEKTKKEIPATESKQ